MRDHERREGATARVSRRTVGRLRERLAEAASMLPVEVATQVRVIDQEIERDIRVADLLGRRSVAI